MRGSQCRVCQSDQLVLAKPSNVEDALSSSDFAITDTGYGKTLAIHRCLRCGFLQCNDAGSVLEFYQSLKDEAYEEGREQRMLQALRIVRLAESNVSIEGRQLRLVDVGAGSGILVEAATRLGMQAEGVEPSAWLAKAAQEHNCRVYQGVLPHPSILGTYDIVTLIDVIEHVPDPASLLREVRKLMSPQGVLVVVTPDVRSLAAKVMGWHWWHFRIAHIGYFDRKTLTAICHREGLDVLHWQRPSWYFTVSYLRERLLQYFPRWLLPNGKWMDRAVVPLNLRDSILFICVRHG